MARQLLAARERVARMLSQEWGEQLIRGWNSAGWMVQPRKIGDRIAMLHGGRIIWHGPAAEIDRTGNEYVDQFVHGRAEGPIQMEVRAA